MKLGKPPIIQAWVEFRFDHGDDRREWNFKEASSYLDLYQEVYTEREVVVQHQFQVEKVKKNQKPQIVDEKVNLQAVRAANSEGSRFLQLSHDGVACNFLRTEKGYEGFTALKTEALDKFRAYIDIFRPTRVLEFALQYVDLIVIPFDGDKNLELDEYFTLGINLPDVMFGSILNFVVQYATQPPDTVDKMEVRLQDVRDPIGLNARFRMDWRLSSASGLSLSEAEISTRLDQAHVRLQECFKKSFTVKTWNMFEPISEVE
ncbi:MAG: TIGR04255 family protein [Gemmataceae bacterium]